MIGEQEDPRQKTQERPPLPPGFRYRMKPEYGAPADTLLPPGFRARQQTPEQEFVGPMPGEPEEEPGFREWAADILSRAGGFAQRAGEAVGMAGPNVMGRPEVPPGVPGVGRGPEGEAGGPPTQPEGPSRPDTKPGYYIPSSMGPPLEVGPPGAPEQFAVASMRPGAESRDAAMDRFFEENPEYAEYALRTLLPGFRVPSPERGGEPTDYPPTTGGDVLGAASGAMLAGREYATWKGLGPFAKAGMKALSPVAGPAGRMVGRAIEGVGYRPGAARATGQTGEQVARWSGEGIAAPTRTRLAQTVAGGTEGAITHAGGGVGFGVGREAIEQGGDVAGGYKTPQEAFEDAFRNLAVYAGFGTIMGAAIGGARAFQQAGGPPAPPSPHELLGVERGNATREAVNAAWKERAVALQRRVNANEPGAEEALKVVNTARDAVLTELVQAEAAATAGAEAARPRGPEPTPPPTAVGVEGTPPPRSPATQDPRLSKRGRQETSAGALQQPGVQVEGPGPEPGTVRTQRQFAGGAPVPGEGFTMQPGPVEETGLNIQFPRPGQEVIGPPPGRGGGTPYTPPESPLVESLNFAQRAGDPPVMDASERRAVTEAEMEEVANLHEEHLDERTGQNIGRKPSTAKLEKERKGVERLRQALETEKLSARDRGQKERLLKKREARLAELEGEQPSRFQDEPADPIDAPPPRTDRVTTVLNFEDILTRPDVPNRIKAAAQELSYLPTEQRLEVARQVEQIAQARMEGVFGRADAGAWVEMRDALPEGPARQLADLIVDSDPVDGLQGIELLRNSLEVEAAQVRRRDPATKLNEAYGGEPTPQGPVVGVGQEAAKLETRPEVEPAVYGKTAKVIMPDGKEYAVEYGLFWLDDLVKSHRAEDFQPNPEFPKGAQGRPYHEDKAAQQHVVSRAGKYNPDLIFDATNRPSDGPPILTPGAIVEAGHGRLLIVEKAMEHEVHRAAHEKAIYQYADQLGYDPAVAEQAVAEWKETGRIPVPGRRLLPGQVDELDPQALRRFNLESDQKVQKGKDPLVAAEAWATRMFANPAILNEFQVPEGGTLNGWLDTAEGKNWTKGLVGPVISQAEQAEYMDPDGTLNAVGKMAVKHAIQVAVLKDAGVVKRAPKTTIAKLEHAFPQMLQAERTEGWGLDPQVRRALLALESYYKSPHGSYTEFRGQEVDPVFGGFKGHEHDLAQFIEDGSRAEVKAAFTKYAKFAAEELARKRGGNLDAFAALGEATPMTKHDAFRESFGFDGQGRFDPATLEPPPPGPKTPPVEKPGPGGEPTVLLGEFTGKNEAILNDRGWGRMWTAQGRNIKSQSGEPWGLDNGAWRQYAQAKREGRPAEYDFAKFEANVQKAIDLAGENNAPMLVVLPDRVGEGAASLSESLGWLDEYEAALAQNDPVAFAFGVQYGQLPFYLAVQDGIAPADLRGIRNIEDDELYTDKLAGIFLGGTNAYKAQHGEEWAEFAREHGLKFHYGRAGTPTKVKHAREIGASSLDSALPLMHPAHLEKFIAALSGDLETAAQLELDLWTDRPSGPRTQGGVKPGPGGKTVTISKVTPPEEMSNADLIADLKALHPGVPAQDAYGLFVRARDLRPDISMAEFKPLWDSVTPKRAVETFEVGFEPTHEYKITGELVQLTPRSNGGYDVVFESGATGSEPGGLPLRPEYVPISKTQGGVKPSKEKRFQNHKYKVGTRVNTPGGEAVVRATGAYSTDGFPLYEVNLNGKIVGYNESDLSTVGPPDDAKTLFWGYKYLKGRGKHGYTVWDADGNVVEEGIESFEAAKKVGNEHIDNLPDPWPHTSPKGWYTIKSPFQVRKQVGNTPIQKARFLAFSGKTASDNPFSRTGFKKGATNIQIFDRQTGETVTAETVPDVDLLLQERAGVPAYLQGPIVDHTSVPCPDCGAPPGEVCRSMEGPRSQGIPHKARELFVNKARRTQKKLQQGLFGDTGPGTRGTSEGGFVGRRHPESNTARARMVARQQAKEFLGPDATPEAIDWLASRKLNEVPGSTVASGGNHTENVRAASLEDALHAGPDLPPERQADIAAWLTGQGREAFGARARPNQSERGAVGVTPVPGQPGAFALVRQRAGEVTRKTKGFVRRNFTAAGDLPPPVFARKIKRDGWFNSQLKIAEYTMRDFRAAVRQVKGIKGQHRLSNAELEAINEVLAGAAPASSVPKPIADVVERMREQIDALSRRMQDNGLVQGELVGVFDENMGIYLRRSYQMYDDPEWAQKVPEDVRNKAKSLIRGEIAGYYAKNNVPITPTELEELTAGYIEKLLYNEDMSIYTHLKGGKLGSKDLSMLKKRLDMSPEIRALKGEYKDVRYNYVRTVISSAQAIANHEFLTDVAKDGMGVIFFDKPIVRDGVAYSARIASEGSKAMNPLNGKYTTPEIKAAFEHIEKSDVVGDWMRGYMKVNTAVKVSKTILSQMTHVRNFFANPLFLIANGHWPVRHLNAAMSSVTANVGGVEIALDKLGRDTQKWRDFHLELLELGVVGESSKANELRDIVLDASKRGWRDYGIDPTQTAIRRVLGVAGGFYGAEDDFHKTIFFLLEYKRLRWAQEEPGFNESVKDTKLKASTITRNHMPTYSLVSPAVKSLRRAPVVGTFVSFPAEVWRTSYHLLDRIHKEMKDPNPRVRKIGHQRLIGTLIAAATIPAAAKASRMIHGIAVGDDDDLRHFLPPWSRNSSIMYLGRAENGDVKYIDMSYTDPHNYIRKAVTAMLQGRPWDEALAQSIWEIAAPFIGEEILYERIADIQRNTKKNGGRVYNPEAPLEDQMVEVLEHIWGALEPGTISSLERIDKALGNKVTEHGRSYDFGEEMMAMFLGVRFSRVNMRQALTFKALGSKRAMDDAERILNKAVADRSILTRNDIRRAHADMEASRQRIWRETRTYLEAANRLGVKKEELGPILVQAGWSQSDAAAMLVGYYPAHTPSTQFYGKTANPQSQARQEFIQSLADSTAAAVNQRPGP